MSTPTPQSETSKSSIPQALTIEAAGVALRAGETTSVELVTALQRAADRLDETLGTWIARFDSEALAAAAEADRERADGHDRGPLHGIPLGIKDILATDEGPTTAQSLVLDPSWGDQGDAPVVERLRQAGAIIMGKTTTMEFAIGRPDFSKPFPIPRCPWDTDRWTGGSSSGTGNGVASGQILGGLGTDTAGSVRLPAAYNGISGHKPTFGLVPKSGCVPLGMSYDHVGPMARSAWDCAAMLGVMAGRHDDDRTTVDRPTDEYDYVAALAGGIDGRTVGIVSNEAIAAGSSDNTMAVFAEAINELAASGATITEVEVPLYRELVDGAFLGLEAEALAWHRETMAERWEDYGRPTRLTIAQGALLSAADVVQIERVRHVARARTLALLDELGVDLLISPTTGYGAAPFTGADPASIAIGALHTPAWNSTGFPALSIPMGFDDEHVPLGLQIIGRPFADGLVLAAGHAYQQRTGWHLEVAPHHR